MSESTAVAKRQSMAPEIADRIAEAKARNAIVAAIRGTVWSKDMSEVQMRSIAEYCHRNAMDPVRHVEVLGGRIYLTATFYQELAAPLILAGHVIPELPDHVHVDARLDTLADAGDAWAKGEKLRRTKERIMWNIPDKAEGAVVQRIRIASTGAVVAGVGFCGKGVRMQEKDEWVYDKAQGKRVPSGKKELKDMDPIGGMEPGKTAETRASRRAWKLVCAAMPELAAKVDAIESQVGAVEDAIVEDVERTESQRLQLSSGAQRGAVIPAPPAGDEYGIGEPIHGQGTAKPLTAEEMASHHGDNPYGLWPQDGEGKAA